jgi:hypothetical protein
MAAGDSFEPDELTPTDTFEPDDDLNILFEVEGLTLPTTVTALFCGPDGNLVEFDERRVTDGGPYLLGLDWEAISEKWAAGEWFAELYVEGDLEAVLYFTVG